MRRRGTEFRVEVVDQDLPRLPFAKITDEIEQLRSVEEYMVRESQRMDRLQRGLVSAHPGHLVILAGMPPAMWARLPVGWQTMARLSLTPQKPPVPRNIKGAVAVSADLAEEIVKRATSDAA
jgi:hypothetical protein